MPRFSFYGCGAEPVVVDNTPVYRASRRGTFAEIAGFPDARFRLHHARSRRPALVRDRGIVKTGSLRGRSCRIRAGRFTEAAACADDPDLGSRSTSAPSPSSRRSCRCRGVLYLFYETLFLQATYDRVIRTSSGSPANRRGADGVVNRSRASRRHAGRAALRGRAERLAPVYEYRAATVRRGGSGDAGGFDGTRPADA